MLIVRSLRERTAFLMNPIIFKRTVSFCTRATIFYISSRPTRLGDRVLVIDHKVTQDFLNDI